MAELVDDGVVLTVEPLVLLLPAPPPPPLPVGSSDLRVEAGGVRKPSWTGDDGAGAGDDSSLRCFLMKVLIISFWDFFV